MEVNLTDDVEAFDCDENFYDFERESFERHFVEGVAAHGGEHQLV